MFRAISILIIIIATALVLGILGNASISTKTVPTIQEYFASSSIPFEIPSTVTTSPAFEGQSIATTSAKTEFTIPLKTPSGIFRVLVATTTEAVTRGLSGRQSLAEDQGMLFRFPAVSRPGFWMKEMNFPLDIIWINSQKKVVGIERNLVPESYPTLYYPRANIKYVLEINANNSATWGIATGTVLQF